MTNLANRPQNKNFGKRAGAASRAKAIANKKKYLLNPDYCKHCGEVLPYRSYKIFCSSSCAASHHNTRRERSAETNIEIGNTLRNRIYPNRKKTGRYGNSEPKFSKIQFTKCNLCHNDYYVRHHRNIKKRNNICIECKGKDHSIIVTNTCKCCGIQFATKTYQKYCQSCSPNIRHYRTRCNFNFNVYQYPEEFDIALIEKYGWYSPNGYKSKNPKPNLTGVSRDHLYSVSEGFSKQINPKILAHPTNCKIMLHNGKCGNNSKNGNSSITLEELKIRIVKWNEKYNKVPL